VKIELAAKPRGRGPEGNDRQGRRRRPEADRLEARIQGAGRAKITVKALSDLDSDAMQLVIPVLAHGAMKWDRALGGGDEHRDRKDHDPEGSVKGASELMVCVSPTHAAMVLGRPGVPGAIPTAAWSRPCRASSPRRGEPGAAEAGDRKAELKAEHARDGRGGAAAALHTSSSRTAAGAGGSTPVERLATAYVMTGWRWRASRISRSRTRSSRAASRRCRPSRGGDGPEHPGLPPLCADDGPASGTTSCGPGWTDKLGELNDYSKALLALV